MGVLFPFSDDECEPLCEGFLEGNTHEMAKLKYPLPSPFESLKEKKRVFWEEEVFVEEKALPYDWRRVNRRGRANSVEEDVPVPNRVPHVLKEFVSSLDFKKGIRSRAFERCMDKMGSADTRVKRDIESVSSLLSAADPEANPFYLFQIAEKGEEEWKAWKKRAKHFSVSVKW